jgi:uncharacterized damage-inducible protein DinB
MTTDGTTVDERTDLLSALAARRDFLLFTVRDLTDEQAAATPTRSELCLGGLVKHVAGAEENWLRFAVDGAAGMSNDMDEWMNAFRMLPGETLAGIVDRYAKVAARTADVVATLDLGSSQALPDQPWFEQGRWTVRRVLMHVIGETAQHAGHADLLREHIDGQQTMG